LLNRKGGGNRIESHKGLLGLGQRFENKSGYVNPPLHTLPTIPLLKSEITQIHPHPLRTRISTNTTQSDDFDDDNQNEDVFDAR
jgi:hypothetical protein